MPLTVQEYARRNGISDKAVIRRIHAGTIAATKDGARFLIDDPPAAAVGELKDTETLKREKLEAEIAHLHQRLAEKVAEAEAAGAMKLARMLGPALGALRKWVAEVCAKLDAAEVERGQRLFDDAFEAMGVDE